MNKEKNATLVMIPVGTKFGREDHSVQIVYAPCSGNAQLITGDIKEQVYRAARHGAGVSPDVQKAVDTLLQVPEDMVSPEINRDFGKLRNLVIIPNFTCNFRCSYCYAANGKENKYLSWEKLSDALAYFLTPQRSDGKKLRLTFLGGGEPLLAFDLIRRACRFAEEKRAQSGVRIGYSLVTNGSLITAEIAEFIRKYNIQTSVSFEILPDVQNAQRDQYDQVKQGIETLLRAGVVPGFRAIITDLNICRQSEMLYEAVRRFPQVREISFELATQPEKYSGYAAMLERLELFCHHYQEARQIAQSYGINLANSLFDCVRSLQDRFCPGEFVLTPDGDITCCHRITHHAENGFQDFCYGHISGSGQVQIEHERINDLLSCNMDSYAACQTCPARLNCGGYCLIKRFSYTQEAMEAICHTIRRLQRDYLFDMIEKNTGKMGINVFDIFGSKA